MNIYTIKKGASEHSKILQLLNEQGAEVSPLEILKECEPHRVFAFDGQMGAGKTTFIKSLCEAMGTEDIVNSPTFAIVNVYDVEKPYKGEVYHFDCYRLKDIREAGRILLNRYCRKIRCILKLFHKKTEIGN